MRVHIADLIPGDRLAHDAFNQAGLLVLSKGAVVDGHEQDRLRQHRIEYVEIDRRIVNSGIPFSEESYLRIQTELYPKYQDAVSGFEYMFEKALAEGKVYEEDLKESFQPLVDTCKMERDVVSLLLILNSQDGYTYQHSVQVGMLSYYIARWLGWDERSVQAGKAGFLHDIGKCRIPDDILNKPGKLTHDEYKEIQNHTLYGCDILQNSTNDRIMAIAALQHHERMDGTGYPNRIADDQIHPVSKVVAVADTYSAMISKRVYQDPRDLLIVLKELYRCSFGELDPEVAHTFIRHMLPNFLGKRVELSGGVTGTIVLNHASDFFRPLIQTEDGFIDLYVQREYDIVHVYV